MTLLLHKSEASETGDWLVARIYIFLLEKKTTFALHKIAKNKMKKILLLTALFGSVLQAQNIQYSFSDEFPTVKKYEEMGFRKLSDKTYADLYYRKGEGMIFQVYDEKFQKLKSQVAAKLPEETEKAGNEGFHYLKNSFYWFYGTWNREEKMERLFAIPFNRKTMQFENKSIKMIETSKLASYMGYGKYTYNYSTDTSMLLVTYRVKPTERREKNIIDIIGFNLYNSDMKLLYSAEITMPYSAADMDNLDYEVDSRGNIYMLTRVKVNNAVEGKENAESKRAMRYELCRINQKTNTIEATKISLDYKYVYSVLLQEDRKHDIVITGYYSNNERMAGANGAYIIKLELNDNNSIKGLKTTYCDFPSDVLKAYESERTKKKMEKKDKDDNLEATELTLRDVVFNDDGSMMIIGEEYYVVTHYHTSSNGSSTTTYTYYYNDILVLKTDKDGKTQWCTKIPKSQIGGSSMGLGFYYHQYKGQNYFFYLDNAKNKDLALNEPPATHRSGAGGYLTCVKLDENGKMTKQYIFDTKEEKLRLQPTDFEAVSDNVIVTRLREDRSNSKIFKLEIPAK